MPNTDGDALCYLAATDRVQIESETQRKPKSSYTKDSYNRAIRRACEAAGIEPWSPNRLRHSAATRYGLEAAQVVLGHAKADVAQIDAERDHALAARIMREVG